MSTPKKRRFHEPRFISEIATPDFSTPRRTRRMIKFIKHKSEEKDKKIKRLQDINRRYKSNIASFKDMLKELNKKGLMSHEATDSLRVICTHQQDFVLP